MNDYQYIIVRIQTLHPFPAGVREDGFANIREADIAVKQSFASGVAAVSIYKTLGM